MLINLSNHPLNSWSKVQVETAKKEYGEILEIPFPNVNPNENEIGIKRLADKYYKMCEEKLNEQPNKKNAIHLMGELNFCFLLGTKLLKKGIIVVASTSKRNSINTQEGKIIKFEFVRFRKYDTFV